MNDCSFDYQDSQLIIAHFKNKRIAYRSNEFQRYA